MLLLILRPQYTTVHPIKFGWTIVSSLSSFSWSPTPIPSQWRYLLKEIEVLLGVMKYCLISLFSLFSLQVIFIWFCVDWTGISYAGYQYPPWAEFVGWMLCIVSIMCVPGYALHRYLKVPYGSFAEVTNNALLLASGRLMPETRREGIVAPWLICTLAIWQNWRITVCKNIAITCASFLLVFNGVILCVWRIASHILEQCIFSGESGLLSGYQPRLPPPRSGFNPRPRGPGLSFSRSQSDSEGFSPCTPVFLPHQNRLTQLHPAAGGYPRWGQPVISFPFIEWIT